MKRSFEAKVLLVILGLAAFAPTAIAAPPTPTSTEAGMLNKSMAPETRPSSRLENTVIIPKEESGKGLSTKKVFTLNGVILDGTSVYRDIDLKPLYKEFM